MNTVLSHCPHIFKISPYVREKKCLKCGLINRDYGRTIIYPKLGNAWSKRRLGNA